MRSKAYIKRKKKEKEANKGKKKRPTTSNGGKSFTPKQAKPMNPGHPQAMKAIRCYILHHLHGK